MLPVGFVVSGLAIWLQVRVAVPTFPSESVTVTLIVWGPKLGDVMGPAYGIDDVESKVYITDAMPGPPVSEATMVAVTAPMKVVPVDGVPARLMTAVGSTPG